MADDWQPGDLALCVSSEDCELVPGSNRYEAGRTYTVTEVRVLRDYVGRAVTCLRMDRDNPVHPQTGAIGYGNELRFRKIRPHTPDEQDAETIRLLQGEGVGG